MVNSIKAKMNWAAIDLELWHQINDMIQQRDLVASLVFNIPIEISTPKIVWILFNAMIICDVCAKKGEK